MSEVYRLFRLPEGKPIVQFAGKEFNAPLPHYITDPEREYGWGDDNPFPVLNTAYALLYHAVGNREAREYAVRFASEVVMEMRHEGADISRSEIRSWVSRQPVVE